MNKTIVILAIALLGASNASAQGNACVSGAAFLGASFATMQQVCTANGGEWSKLPKGNYLCLLTEGAGILLTFESGKGVVLVDAMFKVSSGEEAADIIGGCFDTYGQPNDKGENPIRFSWVRGRLHTIAMLANQTVHVLAMYAK